MRYLWMIYIRSLSSSTVDPCKLLCHLEHSVDKCKLVTTTSSFCENLFWESADKNAIVVDTIKDVDLDHVLPTDAIGLLKAPKGGCDKICQGHDACVDIGSECKGNDVCLNLFWNRGSPVRSNMTTCYELSSDGCDDGTPVLCGKFDKGLPAETPTIEISESTAPREEDLSEGQQLAVNTSKGYQYEDLSFLVVRALIASFAILSFV